MTLELQASDVSRVLTPLCCLPVNKETSEMRLACDVAGLSTTFQVAGKNLHFKSPETEFP